MAHEQQDNPSRLSKVFIGGLKGLKEDDLRTYYAKFGEFKTIVGKDGTEKEGLEVIMDNETQTPKFAFIHYKTVADCDSCVTSAPHTVNGVRLIPKLAVNKDLNKMLRQCEKEGQSGKLKVFIGGLPGSADEDTVKAALEAHYSNLKVRKVIVKRVKETKKPRGFGFLTLESDHDVAKACEIRHFHIDGKQVECKLAPDNNMGGPGQAGGYRGGPGGDRGGYGGYGAGGRTGYGGGGWQQSGGYGGGSGGYGPGYESWGNEQYDDGYGAEGGYSQGGGYSHNGNGYDSYGSSYQGGSSDYYSGDGGYSGGYQSSRGTPRGRGGPGGYGRGRSSGGRGAGARGAGRAGQGQGARHHPYQQAY